MPDADDPLHDHVRKSGLWDNLMAGGAGVEWYFGYNFAHDDLDCEDWRSRDTMWGLTRVALDFFEQHLPFTDMAPADALVGADGAHCLALPGTAYAVYLPNGGSSQILLGADTATYTVGWYDARQGGPLQAGSVTQIGGGGSQSLGNPPPGGDDWAVVLKVVPVLNDPPVVLSVQVVPDPFPGASDFIMEARVADPQFASDITAVCAHFFTAGGDFLVSVPMQPTVGDPTLWTLSLSVSEPIGPASWVAAVQATDMGGLTGAHAVFFSTL